MLISFLFLHENICCGYSLEAPRRGTSNVYPQHMFPGEIRKILCGYPLLSVDMYLVLLQYEKFSANPSTMYAK